MLELTNVYKKYRGNKIYAVEDLSFILNEGEVMGLIGANGAGKSTTVSMIAALIKPDDGKILFYGEDIVKNPKAIRKNLGYVPQNIALYETLSGEDNLKFWAKAYHVEKGDFLISYKKACDIIGFSKDMLNKKVKDYSGGMKKRLNIAASLLHKPRLIILDEPTAGIDFNSRSMILNAVKELSHLNTSVIFVGHYMEEIEKACSRLCILNNGRCVLDDNIENALYKNGKRISVEEVYFR